MKPQVFGVLRDKWDLTAFVAGLVSMVGSAYAWYRTAPPEQVASAAMFALGALLMIFGFYRSARTLAKQVDALENARPKLTLERGPETHPDYLHLIRTAEYQGRLHRVGLINMGGQECEARTVFEAASCPIERLILNEPIRVKGSAAIKDDIYPEAVTVHVSDTASRHVDVLTEMASPDGETGGPLVVSYTKHGQVQLGNAPPSFALQLRTDGAGMPARIVLDCRRLPGSGLLSVVPSAQSPVVPSKTPYCLRVPKASAMLPQN